MAHIVADLMLDDAPPTVPKVLSAFIWPLAIHLQEDNHYLAFLSRLVTEEGGYGGLGGVNAGASVVTLRTLLGRLAPDLPEELLDERWYTALTSAVHALARYQSAQKKRERLSAKIDVLLTDLVAFLSAGILAPVTPGDPRLTS